MPAFPSALRPPRTADSSERQCRCSHGAQRGPPAPRREKRGAVSHRSHHEVTDWKSLLQLHRKGIGLDLPNSPCDPGRATCQRDGRREGHSLSWQCRNFPAPSPNGTAAPGFRKAISSDASASLRGSAEPERLVRCLLRRLIHSSWGTGGTCFLKFLWCMKPVPSPSASASSSGDIRVQPELPWPSDGSAGSLTQLCTVCNARGTSPPLKSTEQTPEAKHRQATQPAWWQRTSPTAAKGGWLRMTVQ